MAMADLTTSGNLESKLWDSAEQLRGATESAQYKHIVIEVLSIKVFSEEQSQVDLTIPEDVSWDSIVARCKSAKNTDKEFSVSGEIENVVTTIEESNPDYTDIFPRGHARSSIPDSTLLELIKIFDGIDFTTGEAQDPFGRIYEYFLREFARNEGRRSGEFYTPKPIVKLLVEILEPYSGKIFDPFCGSGGMFIQSARFIEEHDRSVDIEIYGQELKKGTWHICRANLVRAGLPIKNIKQGDSIVDDQHEELQADRIITNPPFNMDEWGQNEVAKDDSRFVYGFPSGTGNFAFLQHMIDHLNDDGMVGTVMANRTMFTQGSAGQIRKEIIEDDLLDVIVNLSDDLFYSTQIPVSVWVLSKGKETDEYRDRSGETLVVDAEDLFEPVHNSLNTLTNNQIGKIVRKIRAYRAESGAEPYRNEAGFCRRVNIEEFADEDYVVTPGGFVGKDKTYRHDSPEERLSTLNEELQTILQESEEMNDRIRDTLEEADEI